jgi:hypothetical protein
MLVELAAANAAFDIVKQTVANGKELWEASHALATYFGLKREIQQQANKHGYKSDIAAFMAAEELAANETQLKELMIYGGRAGMWDSWLEFQTEIKRSKDREEAEEARRRYLRKKRLGEICMWVGISIVAVVFVISAIFTTLAIVKYN